MVSHEGDGSRPVFAGEFLKSELGRLHQLSRRFSDEAEDGDPAQLAGVLEERQEILERIECALGRARDMGEVLADGDPPATGAVRELLTSIRECDTHAEQRLRSRADRVAGEMLKLRQARRLFDRW